MAVAKDAAVYAYRADAALDAAGAARLASVIGLPALAMVSRSNGRDGGRRTPWTGTPAVGADETLATIGLWIAIVRGCSGA